MHLRKRSFSGGIGAIVLAVALAFGPAFSWASPAVSLAEIRGNVLGADGIEAVPGVVVKAAHLETQTVFSSAATSGDGSYRLADLPSGTYDLAVETSTGLFLSDRPVEVGAGNAAVVSFALQPMLAPEGDEEGEEGDTGDDPAEEEQPEGDDDQAASDDAGEPEPDQQPQKKKRKNFFKTPVGAATTLVVSGVLLSAAANSATDDDIDLDTGSMTPSN